MTQDSYQLGLLTAMNSKLIKHESMLRNICDISENEFIDLFYEYCDTRKIRGIVQ